MVESRKDKRAPAALRVKYKSATVDQFIQQSGIDISQGGIFVKTKKPLKIGALLKFEFQLSDASSVMTGVGRVAWRREPGTADAQHPPGMGLKFLKLEGDTEQLVERIVRERSDGVSRYEDAAGAEVADGAFSLAPPAPASPAAPAPPAAAPRAAGSGARPAPGSGSGPRPASVPSPPAPVAPGGVAGLFGSSMAPTPAPASSSSRSSFFGSESKAKSNDQVADASEFLASAFSGGGASEDTAAAARQAADEAKRVSQRPPAPDPGLLPDDLWDDDELSGSESPAPEPTTAAAASAAPVTEAPSFDDPFADGIDMGLGSEPPSAPEPTSAEQSAPAAPAAEQAAADPDPFGALADDPGGDFGEVDLGASIPPAGTDAPVMTMSSAPPQDDGDDDMGEPDVGPLPSVAPPPGEKKSSRGGLIAALAALLLVAGGGGFFLMTQQGGQAGGAPGPAPAPPGPSAPSAAPASDQPAGDQGQGQDEELDGEGTPGPRVALQVTSNPRGAEVLVRGDKRGESPLKLSLPSGQAVFITVRTEGYTPLRRKVTPGKADTVHFELKPMGYEVVVASEPSGAEVSADGQSVTTPGILKLGHIEGTVQISAQKDGYRRTSRPVRIDEFALDGEVMRASLNISLSPLPEGAATDPAPEAGGGEPAPEPKKERRRKPRVKKDTPAEEAAPAALPDNPF